MQKYKNKSPDLSGHRQGQAGLAAVEMAFTIALLMFMMMATAEFSRLFYQYNGLTKSVRAATRYLSEHALTAAGTLAVTTADAAIARHLVVYGSPVNTGQPLYSGLSTQDVSIQTYNGAYVVISVHWTYQGLFGTSLPALGLGQSGSVQTNLTLHASLAMRALN